MLTAHLHPGFYYLSSLSIRDYTLSQPSSHSLCLRVHALCLCLFDPCVAAGLDVRRSHGGHPLLQGGTHLQEVRPLQSSRRGQPSQGETLAHFVLFFCCWTPRGPTWSCGRGGGVVGDFSANKCEGLSQKTKSGLNRVPISWYESAWCVLSVDVCTE